MKKYRIVLECNEETIICQSFIGSLESVQHEVDKIVSRLEAMPLHLTIFEEELLPTIVSN